MTNKIKFNNCGESQIYTIDGESVYFYKEIKNLDKCVIAYADSCEPVFTDSHSRYGNVNGSYREFETVGEAQEWLNYYSN